jgi:hypothetical protein
VKHLIGLLTLTLPLLAPSAWSEDASGTALTCADFKPTQEALNRFPELAGACDAVVERDGELYGRFTAVVRRVGVNSVTLYLPATDNTFSVTPSADARVLTKSGRKVRPRDLSRGDEIHIYLAADVFGERNQPVSEVALVTESEEIVAVPTEPAAALPTTASPWPTVGLVGLGLLAAGIVMRRRRAAV